MVGIFSLLPRWEKAMDAGVYSGHCQGRVPTHDPDLKTVEYSQHSLFHGIPTLVFRLHLGNLGRIVDLTTIHPHVLRT